MIYLFKTYSLLEFKDFNLFRAIEQIADDTGEWEELSNMEDLEDFIIEQYNETEKYSEVIDANNYLVIVDLEKETLTKKIYALKLGSKDASESAIQNLLDAEAVVRAKKEAEIAALNVKINKK